MHEKQLLTPRSWQIGCINLTEKFISELHLTSGDLSPHHTHTHLQILIESFERLAIP